MNASGIPLKEPSVSAAAADAEQVERALIDASTRVPVLMFYTSAMAWLIIGTLLAGFVSFKLHTPDLLSDISFLTWGRVRPAHMNVMVYGWASMAGMGTAIWLMARLCRTVLRYPLLLVAGACSAEVQRGKEIAEPQPQGRIHQLLTTLAHHGLLSEENRP